MPTKIEWTEETWNPIGGCAKISDGCRYCYAIAQAHRMGGHPNHKIVARYSGMTEIEGGRPNWSGKTFIDEEVLLAPLRRRKPTTYFISLSDLFFYQRPDEDIDRVFAVMAMAPQHRFQVVTKYVDRMARYLGSELMSERVETAILRHYSELPWSGPWPLPNVWLGVSVENQEQADRRIPVMLRTPAALRFVSAEPLLGPLELWKLQIPDYHNNTVGYETYPLSGMQAVPDCDWPHPKLDWVIVGGESGPGARVCQVEWIRSIVRQCKAAKTPVFVKQIGSQPMFQPANWPAGLTSALWDHEAQMYDYPIADSKGGDPSEWPEALRVREYPEVIHG